MECIYENTFETKHFECAEIEYPVSKKVFSDFNQIIVPKHEARTQINYPNGEKYIGQVDQLKKRSGLGKYYHPNGKLKYVGQFKESDRCGSGILFDTLGRKRYVGQWKDNVGEGFGRIYNKFEKLSYKGEIHKGRIHGFGTTYITIGCNKCRQDNLDSNFPDYIGEFFNNEKTNNGRNYFINGKMESEQVTHSKSDYKKSFKVLKGADGTIIGYE